MDIPRSQIVAKTNANEASARWRINISTSPPGTKLGTGPVTLFSGKFNRYNHIAQMGVATTRLATSHPAEDRLDLFRERVAIAKLGKLGTESTKKNVSISLLE
jgi:hypothetical protein